MRVDRRHLLLAGAGAASAGLSVSAGAAVRKAGIDLKDPRAALRAYVKLRGSTAEETVFQPYEGDIFLVADGKVGIPLCGFKGLQKSTWKHDGADGFANADYDLGFYVDYTSREILKTWLNPVTQKTVDVFHYRGGPSGGHFKPGAGGGDVYSSALGRWSVIGDQIWHTSSNWSERPNPMSPRDWPLASSGALVQGSMSLSFAGRLSEVADPTLHRPQTLQIWTNCTAWMPWMEMGQRPGFNLWRWIGAKGVARGDLPGDLVHAAEQVWPGYVSKDSGWTTPTSGRLDYIRAKQGLPLSQ